MKLPACHPPFSVPPGGASPRADKRGIALIVTLILLSVITFLAVAFLFLARRERGAVANSVEQSVARLAAEAAVERARAELLAQMIGTTNRFAYDLRVSTNFINPPGFLTAGPAFNTLTNVNYQYPNGAPVTGNDFLQNLTNLYYSPRPPVFIRTNRTQANAPLDFRFWLDLNRNRQFDTNGLLPELDRLGNLVVTNDGSGNFVPVTNLYVGDPEWIGILDRTDRPHGPNNRFVSRYAWIAVPSGKTLDLNAIHNQAKQNGPLQDGFRRNMGFGTWELNLAAFLTDLNTNLWNPPGAEYLYNPNASLSTGVAFQNAADIVSYRYGRNYNTLRSIQALFGGPGVAAFIGDFTDGYTVGPLMTGRDRPLTDPDIGLTLRPWSGAPNTNHFTSVHDLFDPLKTSVDFTNRLALAGRLPASYDRYTFYRLLSQLGTDSGPEQPTNKLHLNFANVNAAGVVVPDAQTNFIAWQPLQFFTNAVDRLLRANFPDPNLNRILFNVAAPLSLTNVPVLVSNQFVYSPALHRLMQVAANIYDASTNRTFGTDTAFPSVFRPRFRVDANGDIYLRDFVEETTLGAGSPVLADLPLDLTDPNDLASIRSAGTYSGDVYGVPVVVGAKKGFPNFNEFMLQSVSTVTRRLQLFRPTLTALPTRTNQMFVVGISNALGVEAWNSYANDFRRPLQVFVDAECRVGFNFTNDAQFDPNGKAAPTLILPPTRLSFTLPQWRGAGASIETPNPASFIIPLFTNFTYISNLVYRAEGAGGPGFVVNTNIGAGLRAGFEDTGKLYVPQFTYAITNRLRFILVDQQTGRIVDYVLLDQLDAVRNLTAELAELPGPEQRFWGTNRAAASIFSPPDGVVQQIQASLGNITTSDTEWRSYGVGLASGQTKQKAIDAFRVFMGLTPLYSPTANSNTLAMQAPFTPTRRVTQTLSWQANDPLVHYTAPDLFFAGAGNGLQVQTFANTLNLSNNLGKLNQRFEPWSTERGLASTRMNVALKDPNVRRSDDWDFPTNAYPSVGWLGRVHRGTPWQTVYMKSADVTPQVWTNYTGNTRQRQGIPEATFTRPIYDRLLFDVFTAAFNEDAARGQLNVNQEGLAAWSALLSGVVGLTNIATDAQLNLTGFRTNYLAPFRIDPAGVAPDPTNSIVHRIWAGIQRTRNDTNTFNGWFRRAADVLATPELTIESPLLNRATAVQLERGIDDATYERLPQMLMGLLRGNEAPRFTIYAWGQALKPAERAVLTAGSFRGMVTNYQVTAEFATRTVLRIEGAPSQPRAVVESFNILPPD